MTTWQIWLLIAAVFVVIEIFTSGFAVACFSVGCVFGAILAACDLSLTWQVVAFAIGTFLAFVLIRPVVMKYLDKKTNNDHIKTNMDNIIGKTAMVTERIEENGFGRVKIDGDDWKAQTTDGVAVEVGEKVQIESYESIILTVKKL
ncbi:MAG: NfeD family protein [Bacteroidales bacterium]|nr:NfeD family protein [Bacteroidales bacterium]